jgi:dihydroorotate dehydrogenase (fumarate)
MLDLSIDYLGLELTTPLVASSSPLTRELEGLCRLQDAGAGAVVLPSLFEEQISGECPGAGEPPEAFPDLYEYNGGPSQYLELIASARRELDIPLFASLNGSSPGAWTRYAKLIEEAGADALELNLYLVAADPEMTADRVEAGYRNLVRAVRDSLQIPLAVKIGPYFSALAHSARDLVDAGADGLVLFNRFYQPDLDPNTLEVSPQLHFSSSEELRLALRWIAILQGQLPASLAATGGVHTGADVVKALLAGADAVMMASALLARGPRQIGQIERDLVEWMEERGFGSLRELPGRAGRGEPAPSSGGERTGYLATLESLSRKLRV